MINLSQLNRTDSENSKGYLIFTENCNLYTDILMYKNISQLKNGDYLYSVDGDPIRICQILQFHIGIDNDLESLYISKNSIQNGVPYRETTLMGKIDIVDPKLRIIGDGYKYLDGLFIKKEKLKSRIVYHILFESNKKDIILCNGIMIKLN